MTLTGGGGGGLKRLFSWYKVFIFWEKLGSTPATPSLLYLCRMSVINAYAVVQILPWFKFFQTSLIFIFLCFRL